MDWLTFAALMIIVLPFQFMIWMIMRWFRIKFDGYESVALDIINNYYTKSNHTDPLAAKIDERLSETEPEMGIYSNALYTHKRSIIKGLILLTTSAVDEKIQSNPNAKYWTNWVEERLGKGLLGLPMSRTTLPGDIDAYPLVAALIDLASGAWLHFGKKSELVPHNVDTTSITAF